MSFERLVPGTIEWDMYHANHQNRYNFALEQFKGHTIHKVLDAATGVGYGAHYLAENGNYTITAIDRNVEAILFAKKNFQHSLLDFVEDDCETFGKISPVFPFDAVVSFETLEHLSNPLDFLQNCFNSLRNDGILIISTPNKYINSRYEMNDWDFHEKEYTPAEFVSMLKEQGFGDIKIYGQELTSLGRFRAQVRAELNRINSNPFARFGKWIQQTIRKAKFGAVLPEQPEDFEIVAYPDTSDIEKKGSAGPFALIAVCKKIK